jgi:hypothetical protein
MTRTKTTPKLSKTVATASKPPVKTPAKPPLRAQIRGVRETLTPNMATALFNGHIQLSMKLAKQFADKYGRPMHEMQEAARDALSDTVRDWESGGSKGYNPTFASRTTWVYKSVYYRLLNYCTRTKRAVPTFSTVYANAEEQGRKMREPEAKPDWFRSLVQVLSDDAKTVARVLLFPPVEIQDDIQSRVRAQKTLAKHLNKKLGWEPAKFMNAWEELAVAI